MNFEILNEGRSFVLVMPGEDEGAIGWRRDGFHVTVNWFEELRR